MYACTWTDRSRVVDLLVAVVDALVCELHLWYAWLMFRVRKKVHRSDETRARRQEVRNRCLCLAISLFLLMPPSHARLVRAQEGAVLRPPPLRRCPREDGPAGLSDAAEARYLIIASVHFLASAHAHRKCSVCACSVRNASPHRAVPLVVVSLWLAKQPRSRIGRARRV